MSIKIKNMPLNYLYYIVLCYNDIKSLKEDFIMKMPELSLLEWQKLYGTERACASTLAKYRWPNWFICAKCSHDSAYYITTRKVYQCSRCRHQVSATAGTLFHSTNLPLVKWFWAIYLDSIYRRFDDLIVLIGTYIGGRKANVMPWLVIIDWQHLFDYDKN